MTIAIGWIAIMLLGVALIVSVALMYTSSRDALLDDGPARRVLSAHSFSVEQGNAVDVGFEVLEATMVEASTATGRWRVGGSFTGIALLITFGLIGYVLADKLGKTIGAEQIDNAVLAAAVEQMGSKFYISAAGVFCSLVHALFAWWFQARIRRDVHAHISELRSDGLLVTSTAAASLAQRNQSARINETLANMLDVVTAQKASLDAWHVERRALSRATAADQTEVRSTLSSIDASLQGGLAPLVDNIERIARSLLNDRAEELLARLDRTFREGLKAGLADVVSPLHALRDDIQNVSPDQALRDIADKLHGAITGGASESTADFREALEELGRTLPGLLAEMKEAAASAQRASTEAMSGFQQQLGTQNAASSAASERLFTGLQAMMERLDAASSSMSAAVGGMRLETEAVGASLNAEREEVAHLLSVVRASAQQLQATNEATNKATNQTQLLVADLGKASGELLSRAVAERDSLRLSENRIIEIRQGREELEAALRRISQAVADLLSRDLAALRSQSDGAAAAMDTLIKKVDGNIVASLAAQVEDLSTAVASLEKATRVIGERAR